MRNGRWQFWIDRGGTFTDFVAQKPDGELVTHKLLSENPERYEDAALQGIRDLLGIDTSAKIPADAIDTVKMGTTVATNALLERKGDRTVLLITKGFRDALRIGYQNRPLLFARHIVLPELLYERVVEIDERYSADGDELMPVDLDGAREALEQAKRDGIESVAVVFVHGYRHHDHEIQVARLAREVGFDQVSVSHEVSPLMKLVGRGDTTVVDAYVSPILKRYVDRIRDELGETRLMFMQSNGGLADARFFRGKDSILSGPAGGIVGAVRTSAMAGYDKIISFDMGGTSTDVAHYDGEYERSFETLVAGVRMRAPMMQIHTVAAGGGSILHFDGTGATASDRIFRRRQPGAGLLPQGRAALRDRRQRDGGQDPCELLPQGVRPQCRRGARRGHRAREVRRARRRDRTGDRRQALPGRGRRRLPDDRRREHGQGDQADLDPAGHDVTGYTLNCFGGAGGQHACLVADSLGISRVFIHPFAGVLSAYGMGLADLRVMRERAVEAILDDPLLEELKTTLGGMEEQGRAEMTRQGGDPERTYALRKVHLALRGHGFAADRRLRRRARASWRSSRRRITCNTASSRRRRTTSSRPSPSR